MAACFAKRGTTAERFKDIGRRREKQKTERTFGAKVKAAGAVSGQEKKGPGMREKGRKHRDWPKWEKERKQKKKETGRRSSKQFRKWSWKNRLLNALDAPPHPSLRQTGPGTPRKRWTWEKKEDGAQPFASKNESLESLATKKRDRLNGQNAKDG